MKSKSEARTQPSNAEKTQWATVKYWKTICFDGGGRIIVLLPDIDMFMLIISDIVLGYLLVNLSIIR
jgi:hypothetical protein